MFVYYSSLRYSYDLSNLLCVNETQKILMLRLPFSFLAINKIGF